MKCQSIFVLSSVLFATFLLVVRSMAQAPLLQTVTNEPTNEESTLGSGFSYQGQLIRYGEAVEGLCDFHFTLLDENSDPIGNTAVFTQTAIIDGYFNFILNENDEFGPTAFDGPRNIQIAVNCGDGLVTLENPQPLTPIPQVITYPAHTHDCLGSPDGNSQYTLCVKDRRVGIGQPNPEHALDVNGNIRLDNVNSIGWWNSAFAAGAPFGYYAARITKTDGNYSGSMQFYTRYGGDTSEALIMELSAPQRGVGQVDIHGYLKLDTTEGTPIDDDCNQTVEYARMVVDPQSGTLYVCTANGWVSK